MNMHFTIACRHSDLYTDSMRSSWKFWLGGFGILIACGGELLAEDWPQWLGPNRDSVWNESGIMDKFPTNGPPIVWRASIGAGYAGPAVSKGRVYVMDRKLAAGATNSADPFARGIVQGNERILCLNEQDGKMVWKHEYDCAYSISYNS